MNEKLNRVLKDFFKDDYYFHEDYVGIVENIVERMLDSTTKEEYENAIDSLNDELIYYEDQWTVLRYHYVDPRDANFGSALDHLIDDCVQVYEQVRN